MASGDAPHFRRDWTTIGEAAYVTSKSRRRKVEGAIARLEWDQPITVAGPDWIEEVKTACKSLQLGYPQRITFSEDLAPHRLYAVESLEQNGIVRYYVMNMTGEMFVVAADFYPNALGMAALNLT